MQVEQSWKYSGVIDEICDMEWASQSRDEMVSVAWAYYYFSIQFRENLRVARSLYPDDEKLMQLEQEECDTDNLSPWPGVATAGEKMNHDDFMRRTLDLLPIDADRRAQYEAAGQAYLARVRSLDAVSRAASIASYEDGGLERTFRAFLTFGDYDTALLGAFKHFLSEHIRFDSDPDQGHGALSRHILVDDAVLPLWTAFRDVLVDCAPGLVLRADARKAA